MNSRAQLRLAVAPLLVAGCAGSPAYLPHSTAVPVPRDSIRANVYAVVMRHAFEGESPSVIYVGSTTDQFRLRDVPSRRNPPGTPLPQELARQLEAISRLPRPVDSLSLPAGTRVLHEPRETSPEAGNTLPLPFLTFSPIALSSDAREALLYFEYHCGVLCGYGDVAWLSRSEDGQWRPRATWRLVVR